LTDGAYLKLADISGFGAAVPNACSPKIRPWMSGEVRKSDHQWLPNDPEVDADEGLVTAAMHF